MEGVFAISGKTFFMREMSILRSELLDQTMWVVRLLVQAGLVEGKREARQMISRGYIKINGEKAVSPDAEIELFNGLVVERLSLEPVKILIVEDIQ